VVDKEALLSQGMTGETSPHWPRWSPKFLNQVRQKLPKYMHLLQLTIRFAVDEDVW